jgi:hypothetical protein
MSKKPAKKITIAAILNNPVANIAAAQKFTINPINVNTFGLIPVAASAPTILSSSQRLHVPIKRVIIFLQDSRKFRAPFVQQYKIKSSESYATAASVSSAGAQHARLPVRQKK